MDYEKMYYKLFNKITDVINELQAVQQETEDMFIYQESEKKLIQLSIKHEYIER